MSKLVINWNLLQLHNIVMVGLNIILPSLEYRLLSIGSPY